MIRNCEYCNKKFNAPNKEINRGNGKFCSRKCSGAFNGINLKGKAKVVKVELICSYCEKHFSRVPSKLVNSKSGKYFCDRLCKEQAQRMDSSNPVPEIRPNHYGIGSDSKTYRTQAFRNLKNECNNCGYKEYKSVLIVHHKDRNRKNNNVSNLEILCPTCHIENHYLNGDGVFTNMNKGNGHGHPEDFCKVLA